MKKFIPFLISGILAIGAFGCQETPQAGSESSDATNEATEVTQPAAQEASDKTAETKVNEDPAATDSAADPAATDGAADLAATDSAADPAATDSATDPTAAGNAADLAAVGGDITTAASKALKEKLPKSNLEVKAEEGVVTVSGTVSSDAELNEIEPAVKSIEGVKEVKVDEVKIEAAPAE